MKVSTEALLETIYQLSSESSAGATTTIKVSHLDQLRLEIIGLKMANAKLSRKNDELRGSMEIARDRITEMNAQMATIAYGKDDFESRLKANLLNIRG